VKIKYSQLQAVLELGPLGHEIIGHWVARRHELTVPHEIDTSSREVMASILTYLRDMDRRKSIIIGLTMLWTIMVTIALCLGPTQYALNRAQIVVLLLAVTPIFVIFSSMLLMAIAHGGSSWAKVATQALTADISQVADMLGISPGKLLCSPFDELRGYAEPYLRHYVFGVVNGEANERYLKPGDLSEHAELVRKNTVSARKELGLAHTQLLKFQLVEEDLGVYFDRVKGNTAAKRTTSSVSAGVEPINS